MPGIRAIYTDQSESLTECTFRQMFAPKPENNIWVRD